MTYAILIEGHGSEVCYESAVEFHAERLKEVFGDRVRIGYARMGEPSVNDAVKQIVSDGYEAMVVVPMFYAPGWFTDGNTMKRFNADPETRCGTYEVDGKELKVRVTNMFITDDRVKDVITDIIETQAGKTDGILLLGHGSKDGRNLNISRKFGEMLTAQGRQVVCCSNEFDHPDLIEGVNLLAKKCDTITVLPMFVSPSNHTRVEIPEKLGIDPRARKGEYIVEGRKISVKMLDELGLHPGITSILEDLIDDAGCKFSTISS